MEEASGERENMDDTSSFSISDFLSTVIFNPINVALLCVIAYLIYQLCKSRKETAAPATASQVQLPRMKKRDMSAKELRQFDGTNEEGRVCVAVNGKIFDVTKNKRYYGPGGPYSAFAGSDATRGLATFSVEVSNKEYDDLSDLNSMQMESVKEWEIQFQERYDYVGRFLKPGEEPTDYSDDEENSQDQASSDHASSDQTNKKETAGSGDQASKNELPKQVPEKVSEQVFQENNTLEQEVPNIDTFTIVEEPSDLSDKEGGSPSKDSQEHSHAAISKEEPAKEKPSPELD